ncbi:MAG: addiction module protein [Pseudomonadota bacterium]
MSITLPLKDMTVEEKLQLMETLWDDHSRNAEQLQPPAWHAEALAEREAAIARGEEQFEDWEAAKRRIERDIR